MANRKHAEFSLFKRQTKKGLVWHAKFWDFDLEKYTVTKSTGVLVAGKKERRQEALTYATDVLLPQVKKQTAISERRLIDFLLECWEPGSKMIISKETDLDRKIALGYIALNQGAIRKWIIPYSIAQVKIEKLDEAKIDNWRTQAKKDGCGTRQLQVTLQAIKVPLSWAEKKKHIKYNPIAGVGKGKYTPPDKNARILSNGEIAAILSLRDWHDPRVLFAVQLALLVGMRRGELRGLRWGDINRDTRELSIINNYVDGEGNKPCKWRGERDGCRSVFLPDAITQSLEALYKSAVFREPDDFVLYYKEAGRTPKDESLHRDRPCSTQVLHRGFIEILHSIGISETDRKRRQLSLHCLRHTAATLHRTAGIPDGTIMTMMGWKSPRMLEGYSHIGSIVDLQAERVRLENSLDRAALPEPETAAKNARCREIADKLGIDPGLVRIVDGKIIINQ